MPHPDSLPVLVSELDRINRAWPYDRKLLLCPRPAEGRELLAALARAGRPWVGWEPWSLRQLAHERVGLEVAREGRSMADAFDQTALLDEAIDGVVGEDGAGPFGDTIPPPYREPLHRSVRKLRRAGLSPAEVRRRSPGDARLRFLATVLARYEALLADRGFLDEPALLHRAARALIDGATPPIDHIFMLPGLPLRGVAGRLVRALLERGAEPVATDPTVGLPAPAGLLWNAPPDATTSLSRLHDPAPSAEIADGPAMFAAATPADELREVARRVVEAGIPWDQVEIVGIDPWTYGAAMDGLARRLGIPVTYSAGLSISRTRVGRVADAYFRWISDGFPAGVIRQLLERGDLEPPQDGNDSSPAALARRLRRLRIGWGRDRYLTAVRRARQALERMPRVHDGSDDPEAAEAALDQERAELEDLERLLTPILDATPALPDRHATDRTRSSPARMADGLLALLERVPAGDTVENNARALLTGRLDRARSTLTRETTWRAAVTILQGRLETRVSPAAEAGRLAPWTSTGGHLHLSDVASGGMSGRPHTFVVGLAAGAAAAGGVDPLITESAVGRLRSGAEAGAPSPLPSREEEVAEGRHGLAAMLARLRGSVTLSYAAWDMMEGRVIAPAPELLQTLRVREADPGLGYDDLRNRLGRLACAVPQSGGGEARLLDGPDVWLAALHTSDGRLRDGADRVRELHTGLAAGLRAAEARSSAAATAHDGAVPPHPSLDPRQESAVFSASRLETLGTCPLRYFYRYVLGVRPARDPEYDPDSWLDALERGSLLHAVYERAVDESPAGTAYDSDAFADHARRILDQEMGRVLHRLPAPNEAVLRAEREALADDVSSFVAMMAESSPEVVRTELAFGPDADAEGEVAIPVPGGQLRMRGRVDRLDRLDERTLRVVDYKTGSGRGYVGSVPFDGGRRLQHLLYVLAVEQLRQGDRVESMEYHFPTARGENGVTTYARPALEPGHEVLATLLDIARDGRFLPTSDDHDCRYCDFGAVCRVAIDDYGGVTSNRAAWAKAHASELPEYAPLVQIRTEHGSGS